jgi:hypothetical protein
VGDGDVTSDTEDEVKPRAGGGEKVGADGAGPGGAAAEGSVGGADGGG